MDGQTSAGTEQPSHLSGHSLLTDASVAAVSFLIDLHTRTLTLATCQLQLLICYKPARHHPHLPTSHPLLLPGLHAACLSVATSNYLGITDGVSRSIASIAATMLLIPPAVGSAENGVDI